MGHHNTRLKKKTRPRDWTKKKMGPHKIRRKEKTGPQKDGLKKKTELQLAGLKEKMGSQHWAREKMEPQILD